MGAILGIADCTEAELEARIGEMDSVQQEIFYAPSQSDTGRGNDIASFLNNLVNGGASAVGNSNSQLRLLRNQMLSNGIPPEKAIWYHYAAGPASSKGYYRASDDLEFPYDYGQHSGHRNEVWTLSGTLDDFSILIQVHHFTQTPPYMWQADQASQGIIKFIISVTPPSGSMVHSVYTVPAGVGITHIQGNPFSIELGTEVSISGTEDVLFPMTVRANDPNNGGVMINLVIDDPFNIRFSPEPNGCVNCSGGVGINITSVPNVRAVGTVETAIEGENSVSGTMQWYHSWEYGVFPQGYPKYYYQRSLEVFPLRANPKYDGRYISVRGNIDEDYYIDVLWLDSPDFDSRGTQKGTIFCSIFHRGVVVHNVNCSIEAIKWISALDGLQYPYTVIVTIPSYSAEIFWNIQSNQFMNVATESYPIAQFSGRAEMTGVFLDTTIEPRMGWLEMNSRASQKMMANTVANMIGVTESFKWPAPSSADAAESFFYWFMPAIFFILIISVITFVAYCCFPVSKVLSNGRQRR